ncbi:MAG: DNA ligase [Dehalococcoidia bacterium]|nr:DNA ligase [Dehalococcoidia bacterium]
MRFARVAKHFDQLEATRKRLEMVAILAALFGEANATEISQLAYLSQGRVAPNSEQVEFGMGEVLVAEAIAQALDQSREEVEAQFARLGDYGLVAAALHTGESAPPEGPKVSTVFETLTQLALTAGAGSVAQKTELLARLLREASASEAKHLARILLGRLRLGIGAPTVMDALSFARTESKEARKPIERAYNICSDLGLVARTYWEEGEDGLASIKVAAGRPVRPAAAERLPGPEEIIAKVERCAVEPKIDGLRAQLHLLTGDEVRIFSRNLEDTTAMFPELAEGLVAQAHGHTVILDGEAVAYDPDTGQYYQFQVTGTRKRKYGIEELRATLPLKLFAFDILYLDGVDLTDLPYTERREQLEELLGGGREPPNHEDETDWLPTEWSADPEGPVLLPSDWHIVDTASDLDTYFYATVGLGQEGIVAKRLDSPYQAGARNYNWIKLKRSYRGELQDTIDGVIVGYWQGKGHRAQFGIGAVLTALYDPGQDRFVTVTRLGTGFSEEEWVALRQRLDQDQTAEQPSRVDSQLTPDVWVEPRVVIEIQADEITRSPFHTAGRGEDDLGYALRFPRVIGFVREDKRPEDATAVAEIVSLYERQGQQAAPKK